MSSRAKSWQIGVLVALAVLTAGTAQAQIGPGPFAAFPTGDVIDGRFLGFGCTGIATFEQEVNIGMAAPADQVDFAINFFDGDTGKPDFAGKQHWDLGTRQLVYRLYADPQRQGTHAPANLIGEWRGNSSNPLSGPFWDASGNFTADNSMPDNDWWGVTVTNMPLAQAPSGHYFYNLSIVTDGVCNISPAEQLVSNMKIAASNPLTFIMPRFAFEAGLRQIINDSEIIYPGLTFPVTGDGFLNANTNYDGTFTFFINLPPGETDLKLFDGDFDFGTLPNLLSAPSNRLLLPCLDLDDLDTPANYSNLPFPATGATPEGISPFGSPADDVRADAFRRGEAGSFARLGCVRYEVIDPLGNIYNNFNPSGSFEWEQFRIATGSAPNPFDADYTVPGTYLPAGTWIIRTIGLDMSNLNFWAADACAVRPSEGGGSIVSRAKGNVSARDYRDFDTGGLEPACPEINKYLLGDTVYFDLNGDGTQDPGDAGVPGVILNLYKEVGGPIVGTVTTGDVLNPNWPACVANNTGLDTDGLYCFGTDDAGTFLVEVAPENFNAGGALENYSSTTGGNQQMFSLVNSNVLTFDFGYAPTVVGYTVGDRVWRDDDGDGIQDAGEPGINGITVELVNGGGTVIATQVTAGNGIYNFTNVAAGTYKVRVVPATLPAGLAQTYDLDGLGSAHEATVTVNADRDDVDFGYRGTASLGNRIWYDNDGDGIQDGGEAGINGVTVELVDGGGNLIASTITAGDGLYTFANLAAGTYTVRVVTATLPPGLVQTYDLDGLGTPHAATATLTGGQNRDDVDFGYRGNGSLGDRVWYDNDGDGIQDGGEAGLNGVTVQLLDGGGNVIATTVTAGDGNYTFGNLGGGTYTVRVVAATLPPGVAPTYDLDGIGTPHVATAVLGAGASRTDVDFGYRANGSLGDRVWYDADGDGIQDGGENGLNGVTVELLDGGGNVIATTVTAGDGGYTFGNLGAGTYTVRVVSATLPAGVAPTYDLDGIGTAHTAVATLTAGQNRTDVDFGYRGTASLGDRVWNDNDGDGVQDAGETGINGVTVELLDGGGNVIATTVTAGDGGYTFANLAAGTYTVRVVSATLPAGVAPTYDLDGIGTAHTAVATLTAGQNRTDVDFGYRGTASLGDRVWTDTDGDGVQDAGETGINGVTVELLDGGGNVIATTVTAGDGGYTFNNLGAGTYTVRVVSATLPAGVAPTYDLDGIGTAHTAVATLTAGQNRTDVDFGYRGTASLGDRIWYDTDGDGVQDAGEAGLNGVTVELLDGGGNVIATTVTAGDGGYTFNNLGAGTYTVRVVSATLPAGVAPTYDLDGIGTAHTAVATLTAGQNRTDVDFGYRGTASLGDRIWYDADGDGVQDAGEAGLNGVTVELLDGGGNVIASTVTAGNGNYTFGNLAGGTYTVRVVAATLPAGFAQTYDVDGLATLNAATVSLAAGQARTDVDFGYRTSPVMDDCAEESISDPAHNNGPNGHAFYLPGIAIDLAFSPAAGQFSTTAAGTAHLTGIVRRTSDPASGFTVDVNFSDYQVAPPPGSPKKELFASSYTENGGPVDPSTWWYYNNWSGTMTGFGAYAGAVIHITRVDAAFQVGFGANGKNINFGGSGWFLWNVTTQPTSGGALQTTGQGDINIDIVDCPQPGSVGDRVWTDTDGDGIQDPGEPGIPGVTVELVYGGVVIATTTTDANGNYTFPNVAPGSYTVRVVSSTLPAGSAPTYDLDGVGTPHTAAVSVASGENRTDVDFGYRGTGSLGDRLWLDGDGDGVQDAGEAGINGVTVELLNGGGTVIASTTTAGDGNYTFGNLSAGSYSVRVVSSTLPAGLAPTYDLDGIGTAHVAAATLAAGQNRTDVDFGYRGTGSIGDRVWTDTDGDGVQDAGETGINGVTVELLDGGGNVIATTTTAGNGNYTFSNLNAGSYTVRVVAATLPAGSAPTFDLDGIGTANTAVVTLTGGQNRTDVDFGYRGTASLGDRVWIDTDGDGVQDAGETGINGVTVELLNSGGTVIATTVTAGDGNYTFSNLSAGSYSVRVVSSTLPAGLAPTYDLDGIGTAHIAAATLAAGQNRTDVDFGYRGTASLGDRVWLDSDGDGVQDAGETGLTGVTVELLSGATVIATTTTGANGIYTFSNLLAGSYSVRVVSSTLPAGLAPTYDLDGIGTAHVAAATLTAGQTRTDVDFGYRGTGSIGDRVWLDADGDGVQDAGESGLTGVTVELLSGATVIATTTTGANGIYTFSNLVAGSYTVRVVSSTLPAGSAPTFDLDGIGTAHVATATLTAGQTRTDVDFGYRGTASLGDRVWTDTDGDGVQDAGETGINGVTVELLNSGGTVIATTTTAGDGNYTFSNLSAGTYSVRVVSSTLPAGLAPTYDLDGIATAHVAAATLTAGQTRTDVDFGYRGTASLGDRVWLDSDGDGVQDAGETGLTGVTVELLSGATVIATTTTGANGIYTFSNLAAGSYTVRVVSSTLPAGSAPTFDLDGIATAHTAAVTLTAGQNRTDVDFGYRGTASLGDRVWLDSDGDGVQDAGETGLTGVTVELLSGATVIATTTTGANGIYTFSNLAAGSYTVRVVSSTLPAGSAPTFDLDGIATAHTAAVTLTAGQARTDVDFGYRGTASLGDRVWTDTDGDGVQDAGETGINGVTVELLNSGGTVIATTTTAGDGTYTFSNLSAGSYSVRVVSSTLPAGLAPTFDLDGIATAHTAAVTLTAGQNRTDVDFGYRGTASLGDRVWLDSDGDGVQDAGETGLTGVTVELLSGATVIATTTTGANGIYTFSNLSAGSYSVRVVSSTLPAGSAPTFDLDGIATAHTAAVTLTAGQNRTDVDFGYRGTASLGDRVWLDSDGDGVQDAGETGLTGVTVELLSGATVIATTTTGANGIYTFSNLAAGSYTVRVVSSTLPAGSAPTFDLDGIATAHTAAVTLTAGQARTDVDFGYRGTASLGDRVWLDSDGDGVQDAGETGLTGVTVELLSGATVIATTTTGANGIYTFSNLSAGSYSVRVVSSTLPAGLAPTFDLDGIGTAHVAAATLTAGQNRTDVDFGYRGTGSIGDRVWNDADGDGVQDAGETGYTGVTVELLNSGGTVIATTTTGANGAYTFSNLPAGSYTVRVVFSTLPAGVAPTFDLDGIATAHTAAVTLTAGQARTDVDFGYRTPPVVCTAGYYKDHFDTNSFSNNNGTLSWTGSWVEVDSAGAGVSTGNVTVGTPIAGYLILRDYPDTGTEPSAARQANLAGFTSATLSFEFHVRTAVDPSDAVVVEISNNGGSTYTVLDTLDGYTGTYEETVSYNIPAAYLVSNFRVRFRVSNGYGSSDELFKVNWIKIDGGCGNDGSIGDRLWYDTDGDGVQDSGEPALPGVTVELLNSGGTVIATRTTDSNGIYTFDGLAAGNYTVRVVTSTFPVGGLTPTYDLDGTGTAHTAAVTLAAGADRTDVDFGYRGTRSLGDRVWNDADGDGVQDASETGINGVTVRLFLGTTEVATAVTSGNGNYTFTNLPETTYIVRVDSATLPAGMTQTYDLDGTSSAHQATVALTASRTDVDFGYRTPPVSCTTGYFKDHFDTASFSNNDGTLNWAGAWIESDSAGAGVSSGNITVGSPYAGYLFLRDSPDTGTQPSAARQANLSGFSSATLSFSFHVRTGVDPEDAVVIEISNNGGSTYTILETLDGYTGSDEDTRSYNISAYIASNTRIRFRVSNGYGASDELFKVDWVKIDGTCSSSQTGSIGNRVWKDVDGDGVQDSGEVGINGVTVQLLNSSGTVLATTTTAGDGAYTFGSLGAGNYSVKIVSSTLPSGVVATYDLDGTGTAHIAAVSLTAGQNRTDVDFGYRTPPASCTAGYFKDHFNTDSFSNNDGTLNWAAAWVEVDSAGAGVSSGNITVGTPYDGYLFLRDYPDTGTQPSAARQANLSGFTSATLSFSFHVRTAVDPDDAVVIEISKNGGSTYTVLETLDGYSGSDEDSRTYNISSYIASNTRIRFRVTNGYGASDELFKLDWIKIDASCN